MSATLTPSIVCPDPQPAPGMQGLALVAVDDTNAQLLVTLLGPIVLPRDQSLLEARSYTLTGGQSIFPRVTAADLLGPASPPFGNTTQILLTLTAIGDFSVYTLSVTGASIDPFFASRKLRFRLACDERFDCRAPAEAAPALPEIPVQIDYLGRDYASFRQALLDFIPTRMPTWTERSEADLGMTLLELFAATADGLSVMQDRVAGEAYLSTATQRRSIANHLALIGYQMDQGAAAFTWLQMQVTDVATIPPGGLQVSTRPQTARETVLVFETLVGATLRPAHNQMNVYNWGNLDCCLPASATSAALDGTYEYLASGDWLLIEDANGGRDIVRLVAPPQITTPTTLAIASPPAAGDRITIVTWSSATPLSRDYCLCDTTTSPPSPRSWVRGNVVPATHGETVAEEDLRRLSPEARQSLQLAIAARPPGLRPPRQRLTLAAAPLAHLDPATLALAAPPDAPAASVQDPVAALLARAPRGTSTLSLTVDGAPWTEAATLLNSGPTDTVFRVEIDDAGDATAVFGDGVFGARPNEASVVTATYRVGGGVVGNVGADTLTRPTGTQDWLTAVTNPLPATGGRDQETGQHARLNGPPGSHTPLMLVSTQDYQQAAQSYVAADGSQPIQQALASFAWTGSWLTANVAVKPAGEAALDLALAASLAVAIDERRLAGYDVGIVPVSYVPLDVIVSFCTARGFRPGDVQAGLLTALGDAALPGGGLGFFHPDRFSFGDPLFVSQLYASIMSVPGVDSAQITRLAALYALQPDQDTATNLARGSLQVAADQIIRLDNDRNFPQNGVLSLVVLGVES
jgi:hypothetical protein